MFLEDALEWCEEVFRHTPLTNCANELAEWVRMDGHRVPRDFGSMTRVV